MSRNQFSIANTQSAIGTAPTWRIDVLIGSMHVFIFTTIHKVFFSRFITQMLVMTFGTGLAGIDVAIVKPITASGKNHRNGNNTKYFFHIQILLLQSK